MAKRPSAPASRPARMTMAEAVEAAHAFESFALHVAPRGPGPHAVVAFDPAAQERWVRLAQSAFPRLRRLGAFIALAEDEAGAEPARLALNAAHGKSDSDLADPDAEPLDDGMFAPEPARPRMARLERVNPGSIGNPTIRRGVAVLHLSLSIADPGGSRSRARAELPAPDALAAARAFGDILAPLWGRAAVAPCAEGWGALASGRPDCLALRERPELERALRAATEQAMLWAQTPPARADGRAASI